jgi:sugar phosphate isomerase/epimerase
MDRRQFVAASTVGMAGVFAGAARPAATEAGGRKMEYVLFSKCLQGLTLEQQIEALKAMGADGVDFTVRPGYPVTPENVATELGPAAAKVRAADLTIPMVTTPTDLTDPKAACAEPLYRACGEARIGMVKVGYWPAPTEGYWQAVDRMKAGVEGFAKLGDRYGVVTLLHTHSGLNMGLNAAAVMHILRDFDPKRVGAYVDVGHLAVCGEPPALAFAMTEPWLAAVGIKDMSRVRTPEGKVQVRQAIMGEGFVDWPGTMKWLVAHDFGGPLTFHSEFPADSLEQRLTQNTKDIAFLRDVEARCRA